MTEDEWLDACADEPDDDLRRFAFADWLEERGDHDRAEFIRLRVILSRVPEQPDRTRQRRTVELLKQHRKDWVGPLADLAAEKDWRFSRGLPEGVYLGYEGLGPWSFAQLVTSPHLARLTCLDLRVNHIGDAGTLALAASSHLARLTELRLDCNQIGEAGAQGLAASPYLTRLTLLHLEGNQIEDTGALALAASPHLSRLTNLQLEGNRLGDAGKHALRQAFGDRVRY